MDIIGVIGVNQCPGFLAESRFCESFGVIMLYIKGG
jgi:hypothetical protein